MQQPRPAVRRDVPHRRLRGDTALDSHRFARNAAAGVVASIAALSSYWHMLHVALRYGERTEVAHLLPGSVDGMLIVASMIMVDDRRRRRPVRRTARVSFAAGVAASIAANVAAAHPSLPARIVAAWPAAALLMVVEMLAHRSTTDPADATDDVGATDPAAPHDATPPLTVAGRHSNPAGTPQARYDQPRPLTPARSPASPPAPAQRSTPHPPGTAPDPADTPPAAAANGGAATRGRGRPSEEIRRLALQQRAAEPGLSQTELARRLRVSRRRLREILAADPDPSSPPPPADTQAAHTGTAHTGMAHAQLAPVA